MKLKYLHYPANPRSQGPLWPEQQETLEKMATLRRMARNGFENIPDTLPFFDFLLGERWGDSGWQIRLSQLNTRGNNFKMYPFPLEGKVALIGYIIVLSIAESENVKKKAHLLSFLLPLPFLWNLSCRLKRFLRRMLGKENVQRLTLVYGNAYRTLNWYLLREESCND